MQSPSRSLTAEPASTSVFMNTREGIGDEHAVKAEMAPGRAESRRARGRRSAPRRRARRPAGSSPRRGTRRAAAAPSPRRQARSPAMPARDREGRRADIGRRLRKACAAHAGGIGGRVHLLRRDDRPRPGSAAGTRSDRRPSTAPARSAARTPPSRAAEVEHAAQIVAGDRAEDDAAIEIEHVHRAKEQRRRREEAFERADLGRCRAGSGIRRRSRWCRADRSRPA